MIKKLSLFFSAIAIGILSIFSGISLKNAAEPQYFLKNTQIKNAYYWDMQNNTLEIFLDNNLQVNNSNNESFYLNLISFETERDFELTINVWNETNESIQIFNNTYDNYLSGEYITFTYTKDNNDLYMYFMFTPEDTFAYRNILNNEEWTYPAGLSLDETFKINGIQIIWDTNDNPLNKVSVDEDNLDAITPYIGNLETLPDINEPEEPVPPLEQINTLVSDIVNWFTNIFNGLGNVFYDPTANKLTAWGTVMFIGVAIMLISMALKWVISLIRGV